MSGKNEYYKKCDETGDMGFEIRYKNGRLGRIKNVYPDSMRRIGFSKCNDDEPHIFIECGNCNTYMNFINSIQNSFSGKWICPKCGKYVRQTTVNRHFAEHETYDEYDNYYDSNSYIIDMPEACKACGGPFPNCTTSCKLFDD